jgi:hypothetical protein
MRFELGKTKEKKDFELQHSWSRYSPELFVKVTGEFEIGRQ